MFFVYLVYLVYLETTMSKNFSANQYESAFKPKSLNVWQIEKGTLRENNSCDNRPKPRKGHTIPFCDSNGRFVDLKRRGATETAWSRFKSTWNLPRKLASHPRLLNSTARRSECAKKNKKDYEETIKQT